MARSSKSSTAAANLTEEIVFFQPAFSEHRHGFNIKWIAHSDVSSRAGLLSSSLPIGPVVANHVGQHQGTDNNHRLERSSKRTPAASVSPTRPTRRFSMRSSTSSTLAVLPVASVRRRHPVSRQSDCCSNYCHTSVASLPHPSYYNEGGWEMMNFDDLVLRATAGHHRPYPWQATIAADGLPEVISVETGCGKTEGVVLPWLWRRRCHPDPSVRATTPHWLVLCLPLRVLTTQVEQLARTWIANLELAEEVRVHALMGGRQDGRGESLRRHPQTDAVVIGTVDMLLSRALNRGYAMGRFSWPIDFGLLHNGCHWVFDEVQLLGPALPTSRQLDAFRREIGTALPSRSTWMSATLDEGAMLTVDNPSISTVVRLGPADRDGLLGQRVSAARRVERVLVDPKGRPRELAALLMQAHRPGTLTLAILNTVKAARSLWVELNKVAGEVPVTLLHSRYRPPERHQKVAEVLGPVAGTGRIVISTQVVEAGVDVSATTMLIEAAPWPSVIQRAGRCNRDGEAVDARLLWVEPERTEPYQAADVAASVDALTQLEGEEVTASSLRSTDVAVLPTMNPVLRRADLTGLFDTAPDLSGNDIDVAPYIRATEELDVYVAWRDLPEMGPSPDDPPPVASELCPVPLGRDLRELSSRSPLYYFDHIEGQWKLAYGANLRPGLRLIAAADRGGYDPQIGWDPSSTRPVPLVRMDDDEDVVEQEQTIGADPRSFIQGVWVALERHLGDVEVEAISTLGALKPDGLPPGASEAAVVAARLHDVGKAHPVFQDTLVGTAGDDQEQARADAGQPWAKSGGARHSRHSRPYFRHELASALMLLDEGSSVLDSVVDPDLVRYLVAAHHGRVRMGIRSLPDEAEGLVLGVHPGDNVPSVNVPGGMLPPTTLSLDVASLGRSPSGHPSWAETSRGLLDRYGPFRLAFLEAVLRLADWAASDVESQGKSDL